MEDIILVIFVILIIGAYGVIDFIVSDVLPALFSIFAVIFVFGIILALNNSNSRDIKDDSNSHRRSDDLKKEEIDKTSGFIAYGGLFLLIMVIGIIFAIAGGKNKDSNDHATNPNTEFSVNSDLVASIYVVTSDSFYIKKEDMGDFGPRYYTIIPSGTIVSWVYHEREENPKGKYYIYTGDANYRALTDFYERGPSWNLKHIKTITYTEFQNSKWWENIQQDSDDHASKESKSSAEQNEEEIASKDEQDVAGNNGIRSGVVTYNDHYYKLFDLGGTFEEAEEYCHSLGGYLAVISDQKENDFLFSYMKSCGYENTYFGFSDEGDEGVWAWLGTEEKSSFTNWASEEPNHESDVEDYAMFFYGYPDGKWNDGTFGNGTNSDDTAFLCEWKGTEFTSETRKEEIQSPFPQKYWIIFTEGSRGNRVEASSIDSSIDPDKLCFIWDSGIDLNNMAGSGDCNQFFLNDSGKWERIGKYYRMSGDATKILYSSLDVYDADGNLILEKCSINDIDWERIREFNRTAR